MYDIAGTGCPERVAFRMLTGSGNSLTGISGIPVWNRYFYISIDAERGDDTRTHGYQSSLTNLEGRSQYRSAESIRSTRSLQTHGSPRQLLTSVWIKSRVLGHWLDHENIFFYTCFPSHVILCVGVSEKKNKC